MVSDGSLVGSGGSGAVGETHSPRQLQISGLVHPMSSRHVHAHSPVFLSQWLPWGHSSFQVHSRFSVSSLSRRVRSRGHSAFGGGGPPGGASAIFRQRPSQAQYSSALRHLSAGSVGSHDN